MKRRIVAVQRAGTKVYVTVAILNVFTDGRELEKRRVTLEIPTADLAGLTRAERLAVVRAALADTTGRDMEGAEL